MLKPKLLYHFRRNRTYARHERWWVVAGLFGLTLLTAGMASFLNDKSQAKADNIEVQSLKTPDRSIVADGVDKESVEITLTQTGSNVPAVNTWVGLKTRDQAEASENLTYNGWYSPSPARAFFPTDARGQVNLPMMSDRPGTVEYEVYIATMEDDDVTGYQKLGRRFVIQYDKP